MLFNSVEFLLFFPIAVLGYYVIPKRIRYIWLLLCSYYFYMSWNAKYALLILASTVVTYVGALIIERFKDSVTKRKLCLVLCILINLSILFFYKYFNFFLAMLWKVADEIHIVNQHKQFNILLPVGISFYTFQALGYLIDVYRKEIKAEKNFLMYALFVSFFPQLVAGPIERSKNLISQLNDTKDKKSIDFHLAYIGILNMIWGLFLKMVIADRVTIIVDYVFKYYYRLGTVELALGAVLFAVQIYCDFASYSIIAVGAANVLGINLMDNFNTPYLASSIKDFWRRWHISLSSWFRDYLYIPLGGNRRGKLRKYFNVIITFLVSGLWHGAGLNYIVWGLLHGVYQVIGEALMPLREKFVAITKTNTDCFSFRLWKVLATFVLTTIAWIFFRASSISVALKYLQRMFTVYDPWVLTDGTIFSFGLSVPEIRVLVVSMLVLFIFELVKYIKRDSFATFILKQNKLFRYITIVGFIMAIIIFGQYGVGHDPASFIYFQF